MIPKVLVRTGRAVPQSGVPFQGMAAPELTSATAHDVPHLAVRVHLTPSAHACYAARHTIADALATWPHLEPEVAYDILLVTTELAATTVRHAAKSAWLELERYDDVVEVAVIDDVDAMPRQRGGEPELDDNNHGLAIVAALSCAWGVEELPRSRRVWAQVPLHRPLPVP